ncbi:MAG: sigma-70 family RNA polymerase sigma factor [Verrucomicrobia bacterium]|nr:sigma-70 family RNA polymerase sigma factor [Verrucomicrobiota bacterium]MDE3098401.1 sigma-70 family RNA polymerase sigma factor [Verrucomicrobiota bacterium]
MSAHATNFEATGPDDFKDAAAASTLSLAGGEQDALDMARLAAGHDAALNDLMERHAEKLFHYLVRALQNEDDAEDLGQETFARVFRCRASFDAGRKFSTWLYAIASNLVRDRFRWRGRHPQVSLDATNETTGNAFGESLPEQKPSPSETVQAEERAKIVRRAVATLPEKWRLPLILFEYEGKSHIEIGAILGCSAKAVEVRIYRARQELRAGLAPLLASM